MLKELFSLFGTVGVDNKNANKAIDETNDKANKLAVSMSKAFEKAGSIFTKTGQAMTKVGGICTAATGAIVAGLSTAINRFDTLNNYPRVLQNLGFSAEDASRSIDMLSEGIDGLPTTLDDAASSVQRLVAKNNDIDKSTKYFLAMNDAIVAGNAPIEQQTSAMEQLIQSYSKGKPELEEWKTLMTAMPGQLKQVATTLGYIDTDGLYEALQQGSLSMDEFMDKIVELDEKGSEGIISFQEQARNSCDSIGTAIVNVSNRFKKGFTTILTSINEVASDTKLGSIAGIINNLSTSIKNLLDKIGAVVKENEAVKSLIEQITNGVSKISSAVESLNPEKLDMIVTAFVNIAKYAPILLGVGKATETVGSAFNGLSKASSAIESVTGKIPKLASSIGNLPSKVSIVTQVFKNFTSGVGGGLGVIASDIMPKTTAALGKMGQGFQNFGGKISRIFKSVGSQVGSFTQQIQSKIGGAINSVLPNFNAGIQKISGSFSGLFGKVMPLLQGFMPAFASAFNITAIAGLVIAGLGLLQTNFGTQINQMLQTAAQKGPGIITNLVNGITSKIPDLIAKGSELILNLSNALIANLPTIIQGGMQIIASLVTGIAQQLPVLIPKALEILITIITGLLDNIDLIIDAGIQLILGLAQGLINAIPQLIAKAPEIIGKLLTALINNAPKLLEAGWQLILSLANGIINSFPKLVEAAGQIIETIWNTLKELPGKALQWGKDMIQGFIDGVKGMFSNIGNAIAGVGDKIKSFLHFSRPDEGPLRDYETWMPDMIEGLTRTLTNSAPKLYNAAKGIAEGISRNLNFEGTASINAGTYTAENMRTNAYDINASRVIDSTSSSKASGISKLIDLLAYYLPLILKNSNKNLYIDKEKLVGELLPSIDEGLAQ